METLILDIGGMSCGGCVKSVTRIIEAVEDGGYDAALK